MKVPLHVLQARERRNQIVDIVLLLAEGEKDRWSVNKSEGVWGQQKTSRASEQVRQGPRAARTHQVRFA